MGRGTAGDEVWRGGGRQGTKRAREGDTAGLMDERPGNPQLRHDGRMSGVEIFFLRERPVHRRPY
jgi:hypothetical protein